METETDQQPVTICAKCSKCIPESHTGSFTQWVFRSQLCDCAEPEPLDAVRDRKTETTTITGKQSKQAANYIKLPGETFPIDRYKPVRELGTGAAGTVYLCWDAHLSKHVSVKVLANRSSANLIAFQKEARVTAKFQHPNVVSILDFGVTSGGAPFMVLEYVDGVSLAEIIAAEGQIPEDVACALFIQIADALEHGHKEGVFHRDVKSSNILVERDMSGDDKIRVIDFGIASLFESDQQTTEFQGRTVAGTPQYMSPDQAQGKTYDARSEVYSFGCVMYEALTGRVPFIADTPMELLHMHANQQPQPLSTVRPDLEIDEDLENVVLKCLNKKPSDRFASMADLKNALSQIYFDALQEDETETPEPASNDGFPEEEEMPPVSTGKWLVIATIVSALSLIPVMALIFMPADKKKEGGQSVQNRKKEEEHYRKKVRITLPDAESQFSGPKFTFARLETGFTMATKRTLLVDDDLAELKDRTDLNAVNIHRTEVEGPGLAYIEHLPLELLDLTETPIRDPALDHVAKMTKLNYLYLQGCILTPDSLKKLQDLKLLRLNIGKSELNKEGLQNLTKIKTLETLEIQQTPNIDADALKVVHEFPNLKNLVVTTERRVPEAFYKELGTFPKLNISFVGDYISPRNLKHVDVYGLGLNGMEITDAHVAVLKEMKNLRSLEFGLVAISHKVFDGITNLKLTELSLGILPVNDSSLLKLKKMTTLRTLSFLSQDVSDETIAELKKANPKLTIERNRDRQLDRRKSAKQ